MQVNVAIVEDDLRCAQRLREHIDTFSQNSDDTFNVRHFSDGMEITDNYKAFYHIIFFDINMKGINGMEAAEFIRKLDSKVIIIFVTNLAAYAIEGYKVGALAYLLKPVSYFSFAEQLKSSVNKLKNAFTRYLLLPIDNGVVRIEADKVIYVECFHHQIIVHTTAGDFKFFSSLRELEEQLPKNDFFRCNKCYLVNFAFIKSIQEFDINIGCKEKVTVSRAKKKEFMEAFSAYIGKAL